MNPLRGWPNSPSLLLALFAVTSCTRADLTPMNIDWPAATADVGSKPCDEIQITAANSILALTRDPAPGLPHEVHDCQRLVVMEASPRFGPLVGVYPLTPAMRAQQPSYFATPKQVASIFNWGSLHSFPDRYDPLRLDPGWSCLWLYWNGSTWEAGIVEGDPCRESQNQPASFDLDVVAQHTSGIAREYPPTARWGWYAGEHYVGLKCAQGWCAIGSQGFQPRPLAASSDFARVIPGWFDEQHLGVVDATTNRLRPGPWMSIHPTPPLIAAREQPDQVRNLFRNGFRAVSLEMVATDLAATEGYAAKFAMSLQGNLAVSYVYARIGNPPQPDVVRYEPPNGTPQVTTFTPNQIHHRPTAAVRWRWDERDEKAWLPCPYGCCDIAGL